MRQSLAPKPCKSKPAPPREEPHGKAWNQRSAPMPWPKASKSNPYAKVLHPSTSATEACAHACAWACALCKKPWRCAPQHFKARDAARRDTTPSWTNDHRQKTIVRPLIGIRCPFAHASGSASAIWALRACVRARARVASSAVWDLCVDTRTDMHKDSFDRRDGVQNVLWQAGIRHSRRYVYRPV